MIRTLFEKGRRNDIRRAIALGEPLPSQRIAGEGLPETAWSQNPLNREIRQFTGEILDSGDSTRQRFDRAEAFMNRLVKELGELHKVDEFKSAMASAKSKEMRIMKDADVLFTPLELTLNELNRLQRVMDLLREGLVKDDIVARMLGARSSRGKVNP
jgi:hypothetical protein